MIRVAMVEDDADLRDEASFSLRREGFQVAACADGRALDAWLRTDSIDVAVLDIGLPGENGLAIARRLRRAHPDCGIVMLTAHAETEDRILGMEEGADAYLAKPVDFRELALVLRAVARRVAPAAPVAGLVLIEREQSLMLHDGRRVDLTRLETQLLSRLARAPGQQATREQLVAALGVRYAEYDPRRLEAAMSRLRKKLAEAGCGDEALRAVRHAGYVLAPPLSERDGLN
ncbi:MAG: response regulator transcription factor [Rhodocyclales bacterium]|nr:response regulator transcription factor [Rhodocyclales bacterium]